jgi:hypothetical protein
MTVALTLKGTEMKKTFLIVLLSLFLFNAVLAQATQRIPEDGGNTSSLKNVVVVAPVGQGISPSATALTVTGLQSGTHFYLKNPSSTMANFSIFLPSDPTEGTWYKFSALFDDGQPRTVPTAATSTMWYIKSLHHEIITNIRDMNNSRFAVLAPEPVYRAIKWRNYKGGDSNTFTFVDGKWRVEAKTGPGAMVNEIVTRHTP